MFSINCGNGAQKLRWLADAAALKYDPNAMFSLGEPKGLKLEDGTVLNLGERITERLYDSARVWVMLEEFGAEKKEAKKAGKKA